MFYKLIFVVLALFFSSCVEFRISDEEARKEFAHLPSRIQFGDVRVGDRDIHFAYSGKSKDILIVFVHGSPGSWNAFIDFFKADSLLESMDMVSFDRPGFGLSGFGEAEVRLERQAYLLNRVLDEFSASHLILVGHSLGGALIARMAMDCPSRFSALVFVASSVDPDLEKEEWYRGWIDTRLGAWVTPQEFVVSNAEIMPLGGELELMRPLWEKISVPLFVIHGSEDVFVPRENADFIQKMLPDSLVTLRILEGVDHFIPWSHPGEITTAIEALAKEL